MERFQLEASDMISFHCYGNLEEARKCVQNLRRYNRPILCTEYMARPNGSRFDPILGYFQQEKVGAYNWGFVNGKSQTIYPGIPGRRSTQAEPPVWFHDIFRANGTPYDPAEVEYIKKVTGQERPFNRPASRSRRSEWRGPARQAQAGARCQWLCLQLPDQSISSPSFMSVRGRAVLELGIIAVFLNSMPRHPVK